MVYRLIELRQHPRQDENVGSTPTKTATWGHPANCKLMNQTNNNSKKINCSITLEELIKRIKKWDNEYGLKSGIINMGR